ncbi:hypothetical protein EV182_000461 [Spiromyces aspiralis]|uniref:Uncharacterized protein n=1 Tax=Spiromyces aspiralis TaxID=68401 RepID=A0ACC1HH95_9FUNG|nr:hypothetical protein EV182_000461 [Spiromyces aspiralis]
MSTGRVADENVQGDDAVTEELLANTPGYSLRSGAPAQVALERAVTGNSDPTYRLGPPNLTWPRHLTKPRHDVSGGSNGRLALSNKA